MPRLGELAERLHSTRGGSRETELKELTVRPTGAPSAAMAVTTVTPVAKPPRAVAEGAAVEGGRGGGGVAVAGVAGQVEGGVLAGSHEVVGGGLRANMRGLFAVRGGAAVAVGPCNALIFKEVML